jgi:hypothetical protein
VDATSAQTLSSLAMVLRRMGVELVLTRVTNPGIRRLLAAHGIIAPHATSSSSSNRGGGSGAADSDVEQQLLLPGAAAATAAVEDAVAGDQGFCRVFGTLNEGAAYAEDRCAHTHTHTHSRRERALCAPPVRRWTQAGRCLGLSAARTQSRDWTAAHCARACVCVCFVCVCVSVCACVCVRVRVCVCVLLCSVCCAGCWRWRSAWGCCRRA